jgi:hypothetical protein
LLLKAPTAPAVPPEASTWLSDGADWATIIAAIGTLAAAIIALVAIVQVRRLNTEKSQPYVVASLEPHEQMPWVMELVVRNLGQTTATDVKLEIEPKPVRTRTTEDGEHKPVLLPKSFPLLVPGQRWSTTWDSIFDRDKSDLDKRHDVTITYKGIKGKDQPPTKSVLDWDTYFNRSHLGIKTLTHVADELGDLNLKLARMLSPGFIHEVELVEVDVEGRQTVPLSQVIGGFKGRKSLRSPFSSLINRVGLGSKR